MTSLDSYITLGRSGLRVSPLTLGAMTFGEDHGWGASVETSETILNEYLNRGGNIIDTANGYTNGHSEKILGDYFGARPGLRDRVVLSTKFLTNLFPGDPNGGGAGRKAVTAQLDESLRRMQTDYIDMYWLHGWDRGAPIEETLRVLNDQVTAGKIRYVGLSDVPAWLAAQAQTIAGFRGWAPITALTLEYSLLQRTVEGELIPMAEALGMGVMPWSPLAAGKLTGKYTRESGEDTSDRAALFGLPSEAQWPIIDAVVHAATELGVSPAQVALAWVRQRPGVSSTLIGARTVEQLLSNLGSLDVELSAEHAGALDQVSTPTLDFPAAMYGMSAMVAFGGSTIDGTHYPALPLGGDGTRY